MVALERTEWGLRPTILRPGLVEALECRLVLSDLKVGLWPNGALDLSFLATRRFPILDYS